MSRFWSCRWQPKVSIVRTKAAWMCFWRIELRLVRCKHCLASGGHRYSLVCETSRDARSPKPNAPTTAERGSAAASKSETRSYARCRADFGTQAAIEIWFESNHSRGGADLTSEGRDQSFFEQSVLRRRADYRSRCRNWLNSVGT